jgi:hypothetical protein
MRLVALFNLKPGVSVEEYEAWARSTDLPTVNGLASVDSFQVFKATGVLGSDAAPPYAYVETIDVNDMDGFWKDVSTPAMQAVAGAFTGMADVIFLSTEELKAV